MCERAKYLPTKMMLPTLLSNIDKLRNSSISILFQKVNIVRNPSQSVKVAAFSQQEEGR